MLLLLCVVHLAASNEGDKGLYSSKISLLRDSLNNKQVASLMDVADIGYYKIVEIRKQIDWDLLPSTLAGLFRGGERNIYINVRGKDIVFGNGLGALIDFDYPDANVIIDGNNIQTWAFGETFIRSTKDLQQSENGFYAKPYSNFAVNDLFVGKDGNEIALREDVFEITREIEEVREYGKFYFKKFATNVQDSITMVWRFPVSLPDIEEHECRNFYILLTRDWMSSRHRVRKVQNGYLYFNISSLDFSSSMNPNRDREIYHVNPRCRFINCPVSKGLHFKDGLLYIPVEIKKIRAVKGYRLFTLKNCHFNHFCIKGFKINGSGDGSIIEVENCVFKKSLSIQNNIFCNISNIIVNSVSCENVTINNNIIYNSRKDVIHAKGKNTIISHNKLRNIGWMLNTRAIVGGGENLLICDNVIEDFYYAAITAGSVASNKEMSKLTYIIERNLIRQTKNYTDHYLFNSLADGGGIYIGPNCVQGIIRNNVICGIKGIHSNRGIFLDDGAKNLAVYGNLIGGVFNCYDIDLRLSRTYEEGIPDHNTNNSIFNNIMCGGYRFQDNGFKSNCVSGMNLLLGCGSFQKVDVEHKEKIDDIRIKGSIYQKGKVRIPKRYASLIDEIMVDRFVRKFISFR